MKNKFKDYYLILEVHYFASQDMVKTAYRRLSQLNHPDVKGNHEKFLLIQEANEVLSDVVLRKEYDTHWKEQYMPYSKLPFASFNTQIYDASIQRIKDVLLQYLSSVKNGDYKDAYQLLAPHNQSKMFVRDFVVWQKLIAEIHHLLEFDCVLEDYENKSDGLYTKFKVKVKEYNKLLNRVEEDYFDRELMYVNGQWRVLINDIDVRTIIRKYKKILALNKKNSKVLHKYLPKLDENHFTKMVSKKYFINNSEYELLRFKRYKRSFSIIKVKLLKEELIEIIENVVTKETRDIDCFCKYTNNIYLILLPETNDAQQQVVIEKLRRSLDYKERAFLTFESITATTELNTIKEMLNFLLTGKRI